MAWIAAAIVLVLFVMFPKKMLVVVGVLVLVGGLIGVIIAYQRWSETREQEAVSIMIKYSPEECGRQYPIKVIIRNSSSGVVSKVEWDIAAHRPGFSTDIAESGYHDYSQDRILKPNEGWQICFEAPRLKEDIKNLSELQYSAINKSVTFQ